MSRHTSVLTLDYIINPRLILATEVDHKRCLPVSIILACHRWKVVGVFQERPKFEMCRSDVEVGEKLLDWLAGLVPTPWPCQHCPLPETQPGLSLHHSNISGGHIEVVIRMMMMMMMAMMMMMMMMAILIQCPLIHHVARDVLYAQSQRRS